MLKSIRKSRTPGWGALIYMAVQGNSRRLYGMCSMAKWSKVVIKALKEKGGKVF